MNNTTKGFQNSVITIKSNYLGDKRRFKVESDSKLIEIAQFVTKLYQLNQRVILNYLDSDGDKITITSQPDLEEAFSQLSTSTLNLNIEPCGDNFSAPQTVIKEETPIISNHEIVTPDEICDEDDEEKEEEINGNVTAANIVNSAINSPVSDDVITTVNFDHSPVTVTNFTDSPINTVVINIGSIDASSDSQVQQPQEQEEEVDPMMISAISQLSHLAQKNPNLAPSLNQAINAMSKVNLPKPNNNNNNNNQKDEEDGNSSVFGMNKVNSPTSSPASDDVVTTINFDHTPVTITNFTDSPINTVVINISEINASN